MLLFNKIKEVFKSNSKDETYEFFETMKANKIANLENELRKTQLELDKYKFTKKGKIRKISND